MDTTREDLDEQPDQRGPAAETAAVEVAGGDRLYELDGASRVLVRAGATVPRRVAGRAYVPAVVLGGAFVPARPKRGRS